jgi:hypothetical protein
MRRIAEVPLANQAGRIAGIAQEGRQRRVRGRQAERRIAPAVAVDRLVSAAAQAVLPAAGHQREASGRADRGVGVTLREAQSLLRHAVEQGGAL